MVLLLSIYLAMAMLRCISTPELVQRKRNVPGAGAAANKNEAVERI